MVEGGKCIWKERKASMRHCNWSKRICQRRGQNWEYTPFWRRRTSGLEQWTPSASLWWWRRRTTQAAARDTLDLREENLICYCAADFPKFMEIMKLYLAVYQTVAEAVPEGEDSELYSEAEQELRQQIEAIDPTAIADENGLWSTMLEEFGSGMI